MVASRELVSIPEFRYVSDSPLYITSKSQHFRLLDPQNLASGSRKSVAHLFRVGKSHCNRVCILQGTPVNLALAIRSLKSDAKYGSQLTTIQNALLIRPCCCMCYCPSCQRVDHRVSYRQMVYGHRGPLHNISMLPHERPVAPQHPLCALVLGPPMQRILRRQMPETLELH
jgi:hypothetical protein